MPPRCRRCRRIRRTPEAAEAHKQKKKRPVRAATLQGEQENYFVFSIPGKAGFVNETTGFTGRNRRREG